MQTSAYEKITAPRWGKEEREYSIAKKHPKYVFSSGKNASLIHKVREVKLRWWACGGRGEYLMRLQTPRMFAISMCGASFRLSDTSSSTCAIPAPEAVLCAMCHGEGRNFPRGKEHKVPMTLAKVRLGCISKGCSA